MATRLDIRVSGQSLDLLPKEDERWYMNRELYNLSNLETRNASSAKSISLPKTPNNLSILGNAQPSRGRFDDKPWTQLQCDIIVDGVPIIDEGFLLISDEDSEVIKCGLFGGTASFYGAIKEEPIRSLDFSELDITWDPAGALSISESTTGICIADSLWYSNPSRRKFTAFGGLDSTTMLEYAELSEMGVFLYCRYILDKIFASLSGFKITYGFATNALDIYAIPLSVPNIHTSFERVDGTYFEVAIANHDLVMVDTYVKQLFPIIVFDPGGPLMEWDVVEQRYNFLSSGFIELNAEYSGTQRNITSFRFEIWKNVTGENPLDPQAPGEQIAVSEFFQTSGGNLETFNVSISSSMYVVAGDYIETYQKGGTGNIEATLNNGNFIAQQTGAGFGETLRMNDILPDMSQRQFVKEMFKYFNIFASENGKDVELLLFDDITIDTAIELQIDKSRKAVVSTTLPAYAQTNWAKYAANSLVERVDADASFPVSSQTLVKETTKIQLQFAATDISARLSDTNPTQLRVSIPKYELEWASYEDNRITVSSGSADYMTQEANDLQPGDYVSFDYTGGTWKARVITRNGNQTGVLDRVLTENISEKPWEWWRYNANEEPGLQICKIELNTNGTWSFTNNEALYTIFQFDGFYATFDTDEIWLNKLTNSYDLITRAAEKPFKVQVWATVPIHVFSSLREYDPIYLEEFDAYFYLNKLEQWKTNGLCRLELIELKI